MRDPGHPLAEARRAASASTGGGRGGSLLVAGAAWNRRNSPGSERDTVAGHQPLANPGRLPVNGPNRPPSDGQERSTPGRWSPWLGVRSVLTSARSGMLGEPRGSGSAVRSATRATGRRGCRPVSRLSPLVSPAAAISLLRAARSIPARRSARWSPRSTVARPYTSIVRLAMASRSRLASSQPSPIAQANDAARSQRQPSIVPALCTVQDCGARA